jgi:hypothetical protein
MNLTPTIEILRDLCERLQGACSEEEADALDVAVDHLIEAQRTRDAHIDKAVHVIRDVMSGPQGEDLETTWKFLRTKLIFDEEDLREIERLLRLRPEEE